MVAKTPNAAPWHRCSHKQLFIYLYILRSTPGTPNPPWYHRNQVLPMGEEKKTTVQTFVRFSGYENKLSRLQAVHADLRVNEVINSWRQTRI